jgi:hypothetical protein
MTISQFCKLHSLRLTTFQNESGEWFAVLHATGANRFGTAGQSQWRIGAIATAMKRHIEYLDK